MLKFYCHNNFLLCMIIFLHFNFLAIYIPPDRFLWWDSLDQRLLIRMPLPIRHLEDYILSLSLFYYFYLTSNYSEVTYFKLQSAVIICGLFICDFAYSHLKKGSKWQFSSQFFIFEFKIRGLKWWNISTENNDGNLYYWTQKFKQYLSKRNNSVIFDHFWSKWYFWGSCNTVTKDWIDPKFNLFSNLRLFESLISRTLNANFYHEATIVESLKKHIEIYYCFR